MTLVSNTLRRDMLDERCIILKGFVCNQPSKLLLHILLRSTNVRSGHRVVPIDDNHGLPFSAFATPSSHGCIIRRSM